MPSPQLVQDGKAHRLPRTPGEVAVATYLGLRGIKFDYESFSSGRNPDFLVHHPLGDVVMDVYEPTYRLPSREDGGAWSGSVPPLAHRLRKAFTSRQKRAQGKVAIDAGLPFVLVYARTNSQMPIESFEVVGALFGSLQAAWGEEGTTDGVRLVFGPGGRLQVERNTRFSAVAVVDAFNPGRRRVERSFEGLVGDEPTVSHRTTVSPEAWIARRIRLWHEAEAQEKQAGRYREDELLVRLTIFHNPFAAVPLSPEFAGPHDDQWMGTRTVGTYREASWGVRGDAVPGRRPLRAR